MIVFQTSLHILSFLDLTLHLCFRLHQFVLKGLFLLKDSLLPIFEFTDQVVNLAFDRHTDLLLRIELQFDLSELFHGLLLGLTFALGRLMRPGELFSEADEHRLSRLVLLLLLRALQHRQGLTLRPLLLQAVETLLKDFYLVL